MQAPWRWIVPLSLAGAIWLLPHGGFDARSWGLLCLFAVTICGLITRPIAAGVLMIAAIAAGALLRLFTIQDGLTGYGNVTVWLILAAFLFARGLILHDVAVLLRILVARIHGGNRAEVLGGGDHVAAVQCVLCGVIKIILLVGERG